MDRQCQGNSEAVLANVLYLLVSCDVGVAVPSPGVPVGTPGLFTRHLPWGPQDNLTAEAHRRHVTHPEHPPPPLTKTPPTLPLGDREPVGPGLFVRECEPASVRAA